MTTERVVGSVLLGLALVCGALLVFLPLGAAWNEPADSSQRTTETYRMFTKAVEVTDQGEAASGTAGSISYYDESLDGAEGIVFLRAAGPLLAGALALTIVSLLLTSLPRVRDTRSGGALALPAAALFLVAIVAAVLGSQRHAIDRLAPAAQVNFEMVAIAVFAIGILGLGFATGLGLTRAGGSVRRLAADEAAWQDAGAHQANERNLRCPDCDTLVAAPLGKVPICPTCQFGADYSGPAGPVPGRLVAMQDAAPPAGSAAGAAPA